ncbi:MAG: SprB repeat-containing protein, partial [Bacteroidota bacterium]|nr:SprB repeat-containing protein [Bacteroidota bacterium]
MKKIYYLMFVGLTALLLLGQSGLHAQITSIQSVDAQCFGDNSGKIIMTVVAGTNITGVVVNGPSPGTLENGNKEIWSLLAGTYNLTVSMVGEPDYTTTIGVNQPIALAFELSYTFDCDKMEVIEVCATNGGSNSDFGGVPPYDFYWLDNSNFAFDSFINVTSLPCIDSLTTPSFFPVDMNTYSGDVELYVYDANDCFLSQSKTFTEPLVTGTLVATQGVCSPLNSGSLEILNVSGGVTPYSYTWSTGDVTTVPELNNLVPGNYSVTILDAYDCASVTLEAEIPNPNDLQVEGTITDVACFGDASGAITLNIINGSGSYFVDWGFTANLNLLTVNNLVAGTYGVTVVDINSNCSQTNSFEILESTNLYLDGLTLSAVSCNGDCNGSATITANGGVLPYEFRLYNYTVGNFGSFQNLGTFTDLCDGTYYIEVTDANGCTATTSDFAVTEPSLLEVNYTSSPISCYGGADGTINLQITGGVFPFAYNWTYNGNAYAGNNALSNLESGEYCVTVTDANNCVATICITLTDPALFEVLLDSVNHIICHGGNDGNIGVSINGGAAPFTYVWLKNSGSVFSTIEDLENLENGEYCLTITDANLCTATLCAIVEEPPPLTILGQVERVSCNGLCDGRVKAIPDGGTPGTIAVEGWEYQYRLDTTTFGDYTSWQTDSFFYDLCPGFYSLEVIDAHGCISAYPDFQIWEPPLLEVLFNSQTNVSCYGGADGSVDVSIVGGTTPYDITWSNGAETEDISGLTVGTYSVTVIDASYCEATYSVIITEPAELVIGFSTTDVTCCNFDDGTIDLTIAGGTAPYTILWDNGAATEDLANLGPGVYCVSVTDANGCIATGCAVEIIEPPCLDATFVKVDIDCYGNDNGSIDVTTTGGTLPYTFAWSGGEITEDLSNLGPGNYCLTVTDFNGCTVNFCVDILEPPLLAISTTYTNVTCCNVADGTIDLTIVGGTAPISIMWSNQAITEDLSNLGPGTYCVTVTDANDCIVETCVTITEPACLDLQLAATPITCHADNDGAIDATISGGTLPYTFAWDNGAATEDLSALSFGTYCLTVTDFNGCTITACADIIEPDELILSETHIDIDCFGNNNGAIDLTILGGNLPYSINWDNGSQTEDLNNLGPGTYCVSVVDAKGCSGNLCVTITEPTLLEAVVTSFSDVTCYGYDNGDIDVTISGGTLPYTIAWSNGAVTEDLSNIGPGNYCLTVTDANQCVVTLCQPITEPSIFSVDLYTKTDVSCFGLSDGAIDVLVFGGVQPYTFLWDNGATTEDISNLVAGTYCLTVTDFNACQTTICIDILQPDELVVSLVSKVDVDCYGNNNGSIDVNVVGGTAPYIYAWDNGATTEDLMNIGPGTYCITVTDSHGCTDNICVDILEPADFVLTLDGYGDVTCYGDNDGFINVSVTGGVTPYVYTWSNTATTEDLSNLGPGTYCLTVTDANQCVEVLTCVTITQPDLLEAALVSYTNVTCYGFANGTADVTVTGGTLPYTYLWSDGSTTEDITILGPGTYFLTVTDANLCTATAEVTITEPALLEIVLIGKVDITCYGDDDGSIDIDVTGGTTPYTYLWNDGATTEDRSNLDPGTYSVVVTDANGCVTSGIWGISEPDELLIINPVITDASIYGASDGSIDITVTGGTPAYTFSWSNGATTEDISGLSAGTYSVTVTDSHDCVVTGSWTIEEPPDLEISITLTDIPCYNMDNGTIDLTIWGGTPPYSIVWSNGATTEDLTNLAPGTYSVTVTDSHGDVATGSVTIVEPAELVLSETHVDILCYDDQTGSVDLTVAGGTAPYTYTWSNGETTQDISGLAAGTYDVTVVDAQQCIAYLSATITQPDLLVASILSTTDVSCYGGNDGAIDVDVVGGTMPYTYAWDNGETTQDISGLVIGAYCVTITDANGCVTSICDDIIQPTVLGIEIYSVTHVDCYGNANGSIDIMPYGGTTPYTYLWNNGEVTEDISNLSPGTYCLTVTDANGCVATICQEITEPAELLASATYTNITCYAYENGTIDLTVVGGTLPYTYSWDNGANTEDLANLAPGTYCVTVTDALNCVVTLCETITQPDVLGITGVVVNPLCYGDMNGSIDISVTGGTLPYTYAWDNQEITEDLANLGAGTYCVTVTDANGCVITECFTLTQPALLAIEVYNVIHVDCYGNANGSIDIMPFGGTTP